MLLLLDMVVRCLRCWCRLLLLEVTWGRMKPTQWMRLVMVQRLVVIQRLTVYIGVCDSMEGTLVVAALIVACVSDIGLTDNTEPLACQVRSRTVVLVLMVMKRIWLLEVSLRLDAQVVLLVSLVEVKTCCCLWVTRVRLRLSVSLIEG